MGLNKMNKRYYIYLIFTAVTLLSFCVPVSANESKNTDRSNEKFRFVNEIYSDSWALIIGINEYQNVEPLTYAVADAKAVRDMFVSKYGFKDENVVLVLDEEATKDNIIMEFNEILKKAKEKDRVVVFYAGHGETYKLPSGGDMGYLIPVDGNVDELYISSIPMKSIYDIAEMSYAKHILYLVDACYGGLTLNTRSLKKDQTPEYLRKMTKERGRQVITAGGKDEQVIEKPEWGHSAFTRNLIKGLGDGLADENDDGIITADELGGFIRNRVPIDSEGAHTPQRGRIGSDMGEFVFISETLDDQLAEAFPTDRQLSAVEEKVAQLEKLMLLQSGINNPVPKKSRVKRSVSMKTAGKRALVFPGMGHFYAGEKGKGLFFTGLEMASLAGLASFGSTYGAKSDEYIVAEQNSYDINNNKTNYTITEIQNANITLTNANTEKQQALNGMIGCASAAAVVWLWNIYDIKKQTSTINTDSSPVSVGMDPQGKIEISITF